MGLIVKMPMLNANDDTAELVSWLVGDGEPIRKGEPICVVETTKSAVDILADEGGLVRQLTLAGTRCSVGQVIGFIATSSEEILPSDLDRNLSKVNKSSGTSGSQARWTTKAKILAHRLKIDLLTLSEMHPGIVISESHVQAAASQINPRGRRELHPESAEESKLIRLPSGKYFERVLILGGGGGASLVLDILARTTNQKPVGILDNNSELTGQSLMGVPILGNFDLAISYWNEGGFDTLICTVVRDVNDRASIFERFSRHGIPFANIIDPTVRIGSDVVIGRGNLIVFGSYIATGVTLGDNNFLGAGTYIEHHSIVGSHCTFGPRTSLSGAVTVGDNVKFGTHVAVEPQIEVGTQSVIASGLVLTSDVQPFSVVKSGTTSVTRSKK